MKKLFVFILLLLNIKCQAQESSYKTFVISNSDCNYSIQIDTALTDTTKIYKVGRFSFVGLNRKMADKVRKELGLAAGNRLWLNSNWIEKNNVTICALKKHKLSKLSFNVDESWGGGSLVYLAYEFTP